MLNKKSQVAIILAISVVVVLFFIIQISFQFIKEMESSVGLNDKIESDLKKISSSFDMYGYPTDWYDDTISSEADINRIGFLLKDDSNAIDLRKLSRFQDLDYTLTKQKLGISKDYLWYFSFDDKLVSVDGNCSFGNPSVNLIKDTQSKKSIYYYDNSYSNKLGAGIQTDFETNPVAHGYLFFVPSNQGDFVSELNNLDYGYMILEHPTLPPGHELTINDFVTNGGSITLGGDIFQGSGTDVLGVRFHKTLDDGSHITNADVISNDNLLYLEVDNQIVFNMEADPNDYYYYIEKIDDINVKDFKIIATFDDGKIAAATWRYSDDPTKKGGIVYYFSTFDIGTDEGYETVKYIIYYFSDIECDDFQGVASDNLFVDSRIMKIPGYREFKPYNVKVIVWD